jgi:competence protein ComEC
LLFVLLFFCLQTLGDGLLHVYFLDIGQGDSILIKTPSLEYILIDGGPDDKVLQELSAVMPFYERTIDVVMLSHPHADHVNGLVEVLQRYNVRQVVMTGAKYHDEGYKKLLELISDKSIPVIFIGGGGVDYRMGGVVLDFLYPFTSVQGKRFENINNSSITLRLIYGGDVFFFSGDLEVEGEEKIVERGLDLLADVMKAGHHGSRTASSEGVLDRILPLASVILCGIDNSFSHPHAETVQNFQKRGIRIYRTDLDGRIEFVSNGDGIIPPTG